MMRGLLTFLASSIAILLASLVAGHRMQPPTVSTDGLPGLERVLPDGAFLRQAAEMISIATTVMTLIALVAAFASRRRASIS